MTIARFAKRKTFYWIFVCDIVPYAAQNCVTFSLVP